PNFRSGRGLVCRPWPAGGSRRWACERAERSNQCGGALAHGPTAGFARGAAPRRVWGGPMSVGAVVLGLLNGLTVGLLAVGLVLVYKSNRFLNLAHAQLGTLSALLLA